jgi:hypothetical protein
VLQTDNIVAKLTEQLDEQPAADFVSEVFSGYFNKPLGLGIDFFADELYSCVRLVIEGMPRKCNGEQCKKFSMHYICPL